MRNHWPTVLTVCALAITSCQPSQGPAQTQAAQSAFETAVGAAATQAAPPEPTRTPAPTQASGPTIQPSPTGPIPTMSAELLQLSADSFKSYLEGKISSFRPPNGSPHDAHVRFVEFEYYDNGSAAVMDVGIQKSDDTREALVEAAALNAFTDIYGRSALVPDTNAWGQALFLPRQLSVFRIHIYDLSNKERFRLSGNWQDVIDYSEGSLTKDEFLTRLKGEQGVE